MHTATKNFAKRDAMRKTWCNTTLFKEDGNKVGFFLGRSKDSAVEKAIKEENEKHHDIIQADFLDTYYNITYKAVVALTWINTNCKGLKWTIKVDDDMFLDMYAVLNHVLPTHGGHQIMCRAKINRNELEIERRSKTQVKWALQDDFFPGQTHYPPYCVGIVVFISASLIERFLEASRHVHYFWIDDVYLSGMLRERGGNATILALNKLSPIYYELSKDRAITRAKLLNKAPFMSVLLQNDSTAMYTLWKRAQTWHKSNNPNRYKSGYIF